MVQHRGTHDLLKAKIGDEFEPIEIVVTEEMVERNAFANDDYNPWYMEDSPFGGRIASPTFLTFHESRIFRGYYAIPPGGSLHQKLEIEFINPLKVGKKLKMSGKLVDRYNKRGRDYFVAEYLVVDEDGAEIIRMGKIRAVPVTDRPEG